jgi:hypothetical protein
LTSERPIFIVGCPRSGTTMLQLMLHAHPRIAIPPETRFLLDAYDRRRSFGDLREEANRRRLGEWIVAPGHAFKDLGLRKARIVSEIAAGPPSVGSAVGIVFAAYARRFGKPRWGDKRPAYLMNVDTVLRLFPDAQLVHIVRDGRDCVASLKEAPWHSGGVYQAITSWNAGMDEARKAARRLGPDSWYELRYEQLVTDPVTELGRLCGYLGERYDSAMEVPSQVAAVAVPQRKIWHALTHGEVTARRVGSWVGRLDDAEIGLCEALMGNRLTAHGYDVGGGYAAGMREWARYARYGARARISRGKRAMRSAYRRLNPPTGVARV